VVTFDNSFQSSAKVLALRRRGDEALLTGNIWKCIRLRLAERVAAFKMEMPSVQQVDRPQG
jgi:hypothetical protein